MIGGENPTAGDPSFAFCKGADRAEPLAERGGPF
jgi:hypothetical protein